MSTSTATAKAVQASDCGKTEAKSERIRLPFKAFILKTPEGHISETGQNDIEWHLINKLNANCETNYHELPDDFVWEWTTPRGTLPKRIQSYYYKQFGVKLSPEVISEIGNLGRTHASTGQTVVLDCTDDIDWSDGDFGDSGSCFWGEKSGAREMIEANGFAVRAYKARAGCEIAEQIKWPELRGYARAWVADIGERLIVWNGYGENTITFARMLALKFNCSYRRIHLLNNGCDDGVMWINGAVGYMVGEHSKIECFTKYDLGWEEIEDTRYFCEVCEGRFREENTYSAHNRNGYRMTVCEDCCASCDNCGDNFTYTLAQFERQSLCDQCKETAMRSALKQAREDLIEAKERHASGDVETLTARIEALEMEVEN